MFDMETGGGVHENKSFILELTDTARTLIECENEVNRASEKIMESFEIQGTKGAEHKSVLQTKISGLKRLAGLYQSMAEKYGNMASKLAYGGAMDEVVAELNSYNMFINDQMEAEKECYDHALSMLRVWSHGGAVNNIIN